MRAWGSTTMLPRPACPRLIRPTVGAPPDRFGVAAQDPRRGMVTTVRGHYRSFNLSHAVGKSEIDSGGGLCRLGRIQFLTFGWMRSAPQKGHHRTRDLVSATACSCRHFGGTTDLAVVPTRWEGHQGIHGGEAVATSRCQSRWRRIACTRGSTVRRSTCSGRIPASPGTSTGHPPPA